MRSPIILLLNRKSKYVRMVRRYTLCQCLGNGGSNNCETFKGLARFNVRNNWKTLQLRLRDENKSAFKMTHSLSLFNNIVI